MQHRKINDKWGLLKPLQGFEAHTSYISLKTAKEKNLANVEKFPWSIRILFEGVLRNYNGKEVTNEHVAAFSNYDPKKPLDLEFPFMPARVLLQDFTGVPCVVDLAAMRSAMARLGKDPSLINPQLPVNLIIDHSLSIDYFNSPDAMKKNTDLEFQRNQERYNFLRWGQANLKNFTVVPPASGICHQVNLEYLAKVAQHTELDGDKKIAFFDSLVGTDSHTTMINGLGVLGWGVGGIEAEAAMLGQPVYMLLPPVVGVRLTGKPGSGITSTDIVLRLTELLRKHGVVNKIVEYFGPGMESMNVPDRATIANMAPEYGATAGYFPVDKKSLEYLYQTGRDEQQIALVEAYYRQQDMFWTKDSPVAEYETVLELDLATIKASIAGPKRPQDRVQLENVAQSFKQALSDGLDVRGFALNPAELDASGLALNEQGVEVNLKHGDVVIASITSCTNTSSPALLLGAGLLAKKAIERGLKRKPWVKTSFAPGSVVVTEYLIKAGLMTYLEQLGFYLVGYGCATCIGNSGPLPEGIAKSIEANKIVAAAVLSGNRNFEGRVNPSTRANYLASPPLCVAYALAGNMGVDLSRDSLGTDNEGKPVYLSEIWPDDKELAEYITKALDRESFIQAYTDIEKSNPVWNLLETSNNQIYEWDPNSTYIQEPPFFDSLSSGEGSIAAIKNARVLAIFGDSITTDHISPAGSIATKSPAGEYLQAKGIIRQDFNSYGSRRGNDRIMTRGTFANIRLRNTMVPGVEGGITVDHETGKQTSIYEAGTKYKQQGIASIILAGKDYGMGSSRDWAAKGVMLLGVKAVIAESFERIHRSNLVGMGVLPLQFAGNESALSLGLDGSEIFSIEIDDTIVPKSKLIVDVQKKDGSTLKVHVIVRIDSAVEVSYYRNGGILQTVLKNYL